MRPVSVIITGATGLMGQTLVRKLRQASSSLSLTCITRSSTHHACLQDLNSNITFISGDTALPDTWQRVFEQSLPETIIHLVQLRQVPTILAILKQATYSPRLIIIGTTGVYSRYNAYSQEYKAAEALLNHYRGSYCLLRPTMIYGSHRDKNLHKLIKFCDRYGFFPVFGSGQYLLQPVHADDLAQALLSVFLKPHVTGAYDLSGGTVVTFVELLKLVQKLLGKPIRPLYIPYRLGVWSATLTETLLGVKAPVRKEQILRLQEDKAYSYKAASQAFGYMPRSLEVGLAEEVNILRLEGLISR
ncbi:MAG: NAD-dependent epimerase/dehydratase family protein [Cyanobacteria bacterium P01_C01_bin.120]